MNVTLKQVRVTYLEVDGRNLSLRIYKQLDLVSPFEIHPLGRVNSGLSYGYFGEDQNYYKSSPVIEVVGVRADDTALVRCAIEKFRRGGRLPGFPHLKSPPCYHSRAEYGEYYAALDRLDQRIEEFRRLPLIIL